MDVVSLGYRTDLALLEIGGSQFDDRGDHLIIASPDNPDFYWGNFVLFDHLPADAEEAQRWLDLFHTTFPDRRHIAIGVDGTTGTAEDLAPFRELGLTPMTSAVMTAQSVRPPPRPNTEATYRRIETDDDWAQHVELRMAIDEVADVDLHRRFIEAKARTSRRLFEAGHGAWFGAFVDGTMRSTMGLVRAGVGLARFQNVETHPEARGRGLAGSLVHHVSQYGFVDLGAETLVMVADPDYVAIRVYESVGFVASESQLGIEKPS
jgi:ribosomal protein S18 acetylase RimI-like enzyme